MTFLADARQHRAVADRNEQLADHLTGRALDWSVVIMFYAAMHHVESFFVARGLRASTSHGDRRRRMPRYFSRSFRNKYWTLYHQSCRARYDCWTPKQHDYDMLKQSTYDVVKAHILSTLQIP